MFTLPTTGTYTITIDPRDQLTGTLTFLFATVPDNTGTTAIGTSTTVSTSTIGENAVRSFAGTAGQKLTLTVSGNTYSAVDMTVRDPGGVFVTGQFASAATAFHDVFTLPSTGTYTITIDPRDQLTGTLTFLLATVPDNTGSTAIGTSTTVSTATIGENAVRSFAATAGQQLTLTVSGNTYSAVDITVRDPNGVFVIGQFASAPTAFACRVHVADDGDVHDHDRSARSAHRHAHVPVGVGAGLVRDDQEQRRLGRARSRPHAPV